MRPAPSELVDEFRGALDVYGDGLAEGWMLEADAELWISDERPTRLFLVRRALANRLRTVPETARPSTAGLLIGEVQRNAVGLTLEGAYEVGRRTTSGRVVVSEKSAQLFLYGRDILGEGIVRVQPPAPVGDDVFIVTRRGDVLGMARVLAVLPGRGRVLEPVADRGWYLRSGG